MDIRHKSPVKLAWLLFSLALTLFLVACGKSENTTTTPTPTPSVKTYSGDGYTLSYPQDWHVTTQGGIIQFSPSHGDQSPTFSIRSATFDNTPGTPGVSLDQQLAIEGNTLTGYQNYQSDKSVPATTSIGGDSWKGYGATYTQSGQQGKAVILGDQHPANTGKIFIIHLSATAESYNQVDSTVFQPIFQSFKFS